MQAVPNCISVSKRLFFTVGNGPKMVESQSLVGKITVGSLIPARTRRLAAFYEMSRARFVRVRRTKAKAATRRDASRITDAGSGTGVSCTR